MVFSDTTNKNGCIQFIESLCKLGDGGITNDTTLFKQITSYFNQADKEVSMALLRADKNAKWDDFKYTDFPIASIDLEVGVRDYVIPGATSGGNVSTNWKINKIEVLQSNGTTYSKVDLMDLDEEELTTSLLSPTKYSVLGGSIRFKELPSANVTNGIRFTFQRSGVPFTTSSTTEQPGYFDAYHDLPCYKTASMYLLPIDRALAGDYLNLFNDRLKKLQQDWAVRSDDIKRGLRVRVENSR